MTEKEFNQNIVRDKIHGICQDCMYLDKIVPILEEMARKQFINGLEQGKFDKQADADILEKEN